MTASAGVVEETTAADMATAISPATIAAEIELRIFMSPRIDPRLNRAPKHNCVAEWRRRFPVNTGRRLFFGRISIKNK